MTVFKHRSTPIGMRFTACESHPGELTLIT